MLDRSAARSSTASLLISSPPRASYCRTGFANESLSAAIHQIDLDVRLAHTWDLPVVSLDLGIEAGAAVLHQAFTTRGVAPDRTSFAAHLGAGAGVAIDLPRGVYLLGDVTAETWFFRQRAADATSSLAASFALAPRLGLGKRF